MRELSSFTVQLMLGVMRQELRVDKAYGLHVVVCCFLLKVHDAQQQSMLAAACCW